MAFFFYRASVHSSIKQNFNIQGRLNQIQQDHWSSQVAVGLLKDLIQRRRFSSILPLILYSRLKRRKKSTWTICGPRFFPTWINRSQNPHPKSSCKRVRVFLNFFFTHLIYLCLPHFPVYLSQTFHDSGTKVEVEGGDSSSSDMVSGSATNSSTQQQQSSSSSSSPTKSSSSEKITITKVFDFAGEEIKGERIGARGCDRLKNECERSVGHMFTFWFVAQCFISSDRGSYPIPRPPGQRNENLFVFWTGV